MQQYLDTLREIYEEGYLHDDRTGKGRKSIIGKMLKFDLSDGTVPIVTTRAINTETLIAELIWFKSGSSDVEVLKDMGSEIWSRWSVKQEHVDAFIAELDFNHHEKPYEMQEALKIALTSSFINDIGPIYGPNWRNAPVTKDSQALLIPIEYIPSDKLKLYEEEYREQNTIGDKTDFDAEEFAQYAMLRYQETVDQLGLLVMNLKHRPYSSRHVVNAWIPEHIPYEMFSPQKNVLLGKGALAPCHLMFQCFVKPPKEEGGKPELSLMFVLRSNDFPVGNPYNVAQYGILLHLLAHACDMTVGTLVYSGGDVHIYADQLAKVPEQLSREPLPLPTIWINPKVKDLFAITKDDIKIINYQSHPAINYPVAV